MTRTIGLLSVSNLLDTLRAVQDGYNSEKDASPAVRAMDGVQFFWFVATNNQAAASFDGAAAVWRASVALVPGASAPAPPNLSSPPPPVRVPRALSDEQLSARVASLGRSARVPRVAAQPWGSPTTQGALGQAIDPFLSSPWAFGSAMQLGLLAFLPNGTFYARDAIVAEPRLGYTAQTDATQYDQCVKSARLVLSVRTDTQMLAGTRSACRCRKCTTASPRSRTPCVRRESIAPPIAGVSRGGVLTRLIFRRRPAAGVARLPVAQPAAVCGGRSFSAVANQRGHSHGATPRCDAAQTVLQLTRSPVQQYMNLEDYLLYASHSTINSDFQAAWSVLRSPVCDGRMHWVRRVSQAYTPTRKRHGADAPSVCDRRARRGGPPAVSRASTSTLTRGALSGAKLHGLMQPASSRATPTCGTSARAPADLGPAQEYRPKTLVGCGRYIMCNGTVQKPLTSLKLP